MEVINIIIVFIVCFQLVLCNLLSRNDHIDQPFSHYYSKGTLNDGVHQYLIYINGIRGMQISAGPKEGSPRGLVVRQVTNSKQIVSLIYNGVPNYLKDVEGFRGSAPEEEEALIESAEEGLALRDCNIEKGEDQVDDFVLKFDSRSLKSREASTFDLTPTALSNSSFTVIHRSLDNLPENLISLTKFNTLKSQCLELKRKIKAITKMTNKNRHANDTSESLKRNRRGLNELLILPGTKWCGNGRLASNYNDLDGNIYTDNCCRLHDLCPTSIPRMTRKYGLYNYYLTTISHCDCDKRHRRGVTNILSIPHTKWCGTGYSANGYNDLGALFGADSCCRQHDLHCPFFIRSFERKYGYFNFGLGTLSHCSCDRRFKTCLKQTGTGASDVVGNVFFNIVKSHCFVFQKKKICKKRGFWNCLKYGYEKQAVIREPIRWNW